MITRPVDDVDSERLKAAKEKLAPLNQLLNKPETVSLSFEQLLSRCDLTPSEFEQHLHLMSQSCSIILKRDPKDCWVNPYNPHLLEAWDANIDVQFVLSYHSLIRYICTYMCKSENSVSQYLQTLNQNSDRDCVNERDEMKAIMQAYSKKREISAQEAVARVTSLNMKKSSRAVVFISTDDNPVKMSLPVSSLGNTTPDCVNVWMTSFLDESWIISTTVTCAVVLALIMAVITLKRNKTIWIFLITKIKGQPIPNPAKSFLKDVNFQSYLSSRLTNLFTPLEITSIEIVSPVKLVPFKPEAELLEKMKSKSSYDSSNSGFSNPSYAHLGSAPPVSVSLLTAGNLDPCAADTPYGPVCSQSEDKDAGQEREEVREKDVKILKLLSNGCNKGNPPLVISDYEKVEKVQLERSRLQSLDSGVCNGEEPSQESLEADSINVTESHDEINEEREAGKETEGVFQKLFGGNVDISGKGSIQVCYDYERVQKLQPDSPELQSLDVNNEIEEHFGHQESLEDTDKSSESTNLLPPPCSFSSVTAMSSNLNGPAFRPAPHCNILALMTTRWSLEASGDGYMPKQVES
ncbi:uncharacterized protein LOC117815588 [Notolabrus celidotus]|uniref:uncharacterized protein LOC117815588 n=1 Tax=Notolabrus celidotus TaxID=1203425 RepID=UPI00148F5147|nr:uncharacterized protein LOC117815588 [Notolabrus celidotus]